MTEQQIQSKIIKDLEEAGAYVIKVRAGTKTGIPDIIACYAGNFYAFEVKRDRTKATPLQKYNVKKIREALGEAFIVNGLQDWNNNVKEQLRQQHSFYKLP
jgi:Holliday junction resolvase